MLGVDYQRGYLLLEDLGDRLLLPALRTEDGGHTFAPLLVYFGPVLYLGYFFLMSVLLAVVVDESSRHRANVLAAVPRVVWRRVCSCCCRPCCRLLVADVDLL